MKQEQHPLQQTVDELFALQEQVEKDHKGLLQTLQQLFSHHREQSSKGQAAAQEAFELLKQHKAHFANVQSQLQKYHVDQAWWGWGTQYFVIILLVFMLAGTGLFCFLGYQIANRQTLLQQLQYKLDEIPIVYHDNQFTYVMIKKDSQLKLHYKGKWAYFAEIVRPLNK